MSCATAGRFWEGLAAGSDSEEGLFQERLIFVFSEAVSSAKTVDIVEGGERGIHSEILAECFFFPLDLCLEDLEGMRDVEGREGLFVYSDGGESVRITIFFCGGCNQNLTDSPVSGLSDYRMN